MNTEYLKYLENELDKAVKAFDLAKKEAANQILKMNYYLAEDFGAAYASNIDKVTAAAAKIKATSEAIDAYKYLSNKN